MKLLLSTIFSLFLFTSFATIKTTVADGSWFDVNNWSPSGVPLMEDTIIINHNMTVITSHAEFGASWLIVNPNASIVGDTIFALHGNLKMMGTMNLHTIAVGDGDSTIVYGIVDGVKFLPTNPVNINYGAIISDTLTAGDNFDNYGLIDVNDLITGGTLFTNHSGAAISVLNMGTFGAVTSNQLNATMEFNSLITSENITNNGDISCATWTHGSGIADGVTGKYCISMCFMNVSTISGTIDICDFTPGTPCDLNMGTIAGTVTNCATGLCSNNVEIEEIPEQLLVYPNPVEEILTIEKAEINSVYNIINLNGNIAKKGIVTSQFMNIDLEQLENGIYFLMIQQSNRTVIRKIIKN